MTLNNSHTQKNDSNFANFKQLKKLVVILLTSDNSEKVGCNFAYFKQLKKSNNFAHMY